MVQTKELRPKGFPKFMGNDFFLIGYRVFVRYTNNAGKNLRGLYILKSETDKTKMEFFVNFDSTSTASLRLALKLDSTGVEAISYNATSDYRIKDNVRPLTDCSFTVDHLRPVTYNNNQSNNIDRNTYK